MQLERDAAPGIHRVEDAFTNWYLVEDGDRVIVVDCGVPTSWESLLAALPRIGRRTSDVQAVVLTHAHFDHIGFAERARQELGVAVHVHIDDYPLTRRPRRHSSERPATAYLATQFRAMPVVAAMLRSRAWWPEPIEKVERYENGSLDLPGSPKVLRTPGHTIGHCALHFEDRDAVIAGDALVTFDPYTARRGPRMVARAATADVRRNGESLSVIEQTEAGAVLTGHGPVWRDGAVAAVAQARAAGAA